jgi:hypothetical protein
MPSGGESSTGSLPPELLEAVATALERERDEVDAEKREQIHTGIRAAVDGWRRGRMTIARAVLLLRIASEK